MISSETSIYNLALNAVGARNNVSSPTEESREAEVCRLWFTVVRDQILAAAVWPEATDMKYLALLNEADDDGLWEVGEARPGYQFVYSLPTECLRPQYLSNFDRFLVTYYADNKRALNTNTESAILAFTTRLETVSLWSAELQMAIVYGLASHICVPLSGKTSRARGLAEEANRILLSARESAANASSEQFESVPEWISGRGYSGQISNTRFVYPLGSLLSVTTSV